MDYTDERIIMMRRQLDEQEPLDISVPNLIIGGEALNFERIELFDGFLSAMLPKEYGDMPPDKAKLKYPMEGRPQIIKTSGDMVFNLCFSKYNQRFTPGNVGKATKTYFGAVRKVYPANKFHKQKIKEDRGYFSYTSPGLDRDIFQLQAFISVNDAFVHFIFNGPDAFRKDWERVLPQVVDLIQPVKK